MKELILEEVVLLSVQQYFTIFIQQPDVKLQTLADKGHTDISVGNWEPISETKYVRYVTFYPHLSSNAFVQRLTRGVKVKAEEKQQYEFLQNGELYIVSTLKFIGSSLAESFITTIEWRIIPINEISCRLQCVVKSEYTGYMFKGTIENLVAESARESFSHWVDVVKTKANELQKAKIELVKESSFETQSITSIETVTTTTSTTETVTVQSISVNEYVDDTKSYDTLSSEVESDSENDEFFDSMDVWHETPIAENGVLIANNTNGVTSVYPKDENLGVTPTVTSLDDTPVTQLSKERDTDNETERLSKSIELLIQQQKEINRKQDILEQKLEQISAKLDKRLSNVYGSVKTGVFVGIFLVVWPIVARYIYKSVKPIVGKLMLSNFFGTKI
jgi:hypothetical protein